MDSFFLLLFLLSPIALIISLIKPSVFTRIFRRELSRKKLSLLFGGATILFLILFGATTDYTPKEEVAQPEIEKTNGGAALGETVEELQTEEIASDIKETSTESIKVTRVVDGDTIEIEGDQKVRYIGIDTPETVHPNEPIECFGVEASNKNKELVLGKNVSLEKDVSETDKYGRLLRYVWIGDLMVNEYLVREGYAQSSTYPPDVKYQDRFVEAQRKAREESKGLWSSFCDNWGVTPTVVDTQITEPTQTIYSSPIAQPVQPPLSGGSFTCNCSKTYPNMSSCEEAYFQLNNCGCSIRDGDKDGVPCENICPGG